LIHSVPEYSILNAQCSIFNGKKLEQHQIVIANSQQLIAHLLIFDRQIYIAFAERYMNTYLKFKSAWLQLLIFGSLTFGMSVALIGVGLVIVSKIYNIPPFDIISMNDLADPNMLNSAKTLQVISSIAIFLAPSLVFAYLSDRKPLEYIGFKKPSPVVFWGLSFLLIFASLPMVGWLGHMNENMHLLQAWLLPKKLCAMAEAQAGKMIEKFLEMKSPADLIRMIIIVAVVPAFAEELFFRGVLQRLMIQITRRPMVGIIITAIIFSAIHEQFLDFSPAWF
jgi:membrane protease YdiL (CAAX protease family)